MAAFRLRRSRRTRLRRALARWTPRSVMRRMVLRGAGWGARLTMWAMRKAVRRSLRRAFHA